MGDRMRPIPFAQLVEWVLTEYAHEGSVFGVPADKIYLENNWIGPAAGPHTQLAQNIIAAYVAGGRYFELKTVQIIDGEDLPVSKPCISAVDEGYNVEWSTELTVPAAFDEYVKGWFVLALLAKELALGPIGGFVFNMSVGYDLAGIQSPKIDSFISGMQDASRTAIWLECRNYLLNNIEKFKLMKKADVEVISPAICSSITLSTLHGCPPQEIERIARYLLGEKKLNTDVKCNPTLLGYEFVRKTLDQMGFDYMQFDDHHFKSDLQYEDAIPMFTRLKAYAGEMGLTFGVKLSNTLPVDITGHELPGEEMYMSGRSLYPLTINLACRLARAFDGDLRISYSGGADFFNIEKIYQTGIAPITLATTLLKPGGYLRLKQMADLLEKEHSSAKVSCINLAKLEDLAAQAVKDENHQKDRHGFASRKLQKQVPLLDCYIAPCTSGCPIGQDIPEYIRLAGEGRYLEALKAITAKNPLPFITGTLCNHRCTTKCTRLDYDESVLIREVKLLAAESAFDELLAQMKTPVIDSRFKVAVIGGGPAGLSAAWFLAKNGVDVTIFEKRDEIGGVIQHVAPEFRISKQAINNDLDLIRKMGVKFRLNVNSDFSVKALQKEGYKYIFIAIGAWKPVQLKLDPCDKGVVDALDFLEAFNKNRSSLQLGKTVAVVGAGNSAMDAARSAIRLPGVEKVLIIYRRTRKQMPAEEEEFRLALQEGVKFQELLAPVSFSNGVLKCQQMELGAPDVSGRRSPVAVGEFVEIASDSVIAAVGEQVETGLLQQNGIALDARGKIIIDPESLETSIAGVYTGGDACRGPATIVEGIADGTRFANRVLELEGREASETASAAIDRKQQKKEILAKKGVLKNAGQPAKESSRCLECSSLCNICVEVCPNRANLAISSQVIHLDGLCNECGNCESFCPYDSAPYKDKFTLFSNLDDLAGSKNAGFAAVDRASGQFAVRLGDRICQITFDQSGNCSGDIPGEIAALIWTIKTNYPYVFLQTPGG